jgi:hypothetical protein
MGLSNPKRNHVGIPVGNMVTGCLTQMQSKMLSFCFCVTYQMYSLLHQLRPAPIGWDGYKNGRHQSLARTIFTQLCTADRFFLLITHIESSVCTSINTKSKSEAETCCLDANSTYTNFFHRTNQVKVKVVLTGQFYFKNVLDLYSVPWMMRGTYH